MMEVVPVPVAVVAVAVVALELPLSAVSQRFPQSSQGVGSLHSSAPPELAAVEDPKERRRLQQASSGIPSVITYSRDHVPRSSWNVGGDGLRRVQG